MSSGVASTPTTPTLYRLPDRAIAGGVAAGIAAHLHMRVQIIRLVFVLLAIAGGLGVALYGAYWIVVPAAVSSRRRIPRIVEIMLAIVAICAAIAAIAATGSLGTWFVPTLLACLGGALIWRQATDVERTRLRALSRTSLAAGSTNRLGRVRLAAGATLVVVGAVLVLAHADVTRVRDGLIAMIVTLLGVALLTGPWWMRLMTQLSAERGERIRSEERADIAAHLHDSVLQTLALIQRNANSPREVTRLARGQERELRSLLYDTRVASGQLADEVRRVAGEVEDAYAVGIDAVVVGDVPMTEALTAAVAASREALVNAAKHSGASSVSLYVEVEASEVSLFVKDRGVGFNPAEIADDRQGVRGSIVGRVERHGGSATVESAPGTGTEVVIRMPR